MIPFTIRDFYAENRKRKFILVEFRIRNNSVCNTDNFNQSQCVCVTTLMLAENCFSKVNGVIFSEFLFLFCEFVSKKCLLYLSFI